MTIKLANGDECPHCQGFIWRLGPQDGICRNVECAGCKARFNILRLPGSFQIVTVAEELPTEAEGGSSWDSIEFPEILQ